MSSSELQITWPIADSDFSLLQASTLSDTANWLDVDAPLVSDGTNFIVKIQPRDVAQFFRLEQMQLTRIDSTSPFDGETGVSVTRESMIHFSAPLAADTTLNTSNFYAMAAGRRMLSRVEISSDRQQARLFYLEPLPGGALVSVFLDPEDLLDYKGRELDPSDFPADHNVLSFTTLSLTPLARTAVIGTVYASELSGGTTGTNKPLAGVTVTVDGMEQTLRAITDANGQFKLAPVPPGRFFVHIDGRTLVNDGLGIHYPDKSYYPFVGKAWDAVAGREDNLAGGTGSIYLPLIRAGTLQPVSQTAPTTIGFPESIVSANPALTGVSITVPANSLFSDSGTRGGKVGIAPVPPDRLPGPLPPGLELPIVITVQTDGALNFDQPAPVCFPNVIDPVLGAPLPAGSRQSLMSFNHKKGVWEAVGTMTVSADGKLVCSDPGSGIVQPGWHGVGPTPSGPPPPPCDGNSASSLSLDGIGGKLAALAQMDCSKHIQECDATLSERLRKYDEDEVRDLGNCVKFASNNICRYTQGIISKYKSDREVARTLHDRCITNCPAPPPPPPPPPPPKPKPKPRPKKPNVCRPKPKNTAAATLHALAGPPADPVITQLQAIVAQISALTDPYSEANTPWPASVEQQVANLFANANAVAGGDAAAYVSNYALQAEIRAAAAGTLAEPEGNAPDYPVFYVAEIARPGGAFYIRGQTEPFGQYELFVPRDGQLRSVRFYDPETQSYDIIFPRLRPDAPWRLPSFELSPINDSFPDADHDGLPDVVEIVLGTDPHNADSDGDGISDGAEVAQQSNPLDGQIVQTGVIATTQTVGPAIDVRVQDDLVLTAEGASGVSLFSAYDGSNPVLLSHFNTGGNVQRVAWANGLALAAQPDKGIAIVDVSNLAAPQVRTVSLPGAQAVVGDGSRAYVGTSSGAMVVIDTATAMILSYLPVTNAIWDLAIDRGYLYALTDDHLLVLSIDGASLHVIASVLSPVTAAGNRRLSVGGAVAYTVHRTGYNVFNLTDPVHPSLIRAGNTSQFGWRDLVSNGAGIGLATVGPNSPDNDPRNLSLYDLSNQTNTNVFITQLLTPGSAEAVVIYNGLAYVADRSAGLQVVNYLSYDDKKLAPQIALTPGFDTNAAFVGTDVWLVANATDDVQVRSVELYLDGQKFLSRGTFPFEFRFSIPTNSAFRLRARAIDTGGNASWSEEIAVQTVADPSTPSVISTTPFGGARRDLTAISAYFNKPIDPATVTPANFLLYGAGPDGQSGSADDVLVGNTVATYNSSARAATLSFPTLPFGTYRAVLTTNVTDTTGRHLAQDYSWSIRVIDARIWITPAAGNWSDPANWSDGLVPGPKDDTFINAPVTVNIDPNAKIYNKVIGVPEARLDFTNPAILDAVTLEIAAHVSSSVKVHVKNGLTINGKLVMDGGLNITELDFDGAQTLGGTGSILFTDCNPNTTVIQPLSGGLTIGPSLTITGGGGAIGRAGLPLNIAGTINVTSGCRLNLEGTPFANAGQLTASNGGELRTSDLQNTGTITVTNGAAITLNGNWDNKGAIAAQRASVNLGGTFTLGKIGQITTSSDAIVNLGGTLENLNQTFILDASRNSWVLAGGTIHGGIVQATAAPLQIDRFSPSVLDGVTVTGSLILRDSAKLTIRNGLTLNGAATINGGINRTQLIFDGAQAFEGTADVLFTGPYMPELFPKAGALTLGANVTIHGSNGRVGDANQPLINNGKIIADGSRITIYGKPFTNNGSTQELNGGQISINP